MFRILYLSFKKIKELNVALLWSSFVQIFGINSYFQINILYDKIINLNSVFNWLTKKLYAVKYYFLIRKKFSFRESFKKFIH